MKNKHPPENKLTKIVRLTISVGVILLLCVAFYIILKLSGLMERFDSVEEISQIIKKTGIYGLLVYFTLQFLQVTVLPLPGFVTTIAGAMVFGPLESSICSSVAIILGSICSFFIGRKFGTKLLIWAIGKDDTEHWKKMLTDCKYAYFLMMLFPFFPDDILCIVAGVTNMSYKFFLITNLITRPISVICTCYIGSGYLIPFKGWGIAIWVVMVLLIIVLFLLSAKFQPKIEEFIINLDKKLTKNDKNNSRITKCKIN